ncbi:hypothetical protein T4B_10627 [Trichinella pseudospiralis]|uniref:Uncharacterized protein n=2 Tax=Trichinella pseudospiralis TaxID=6337 RepID=A0A0V1EQT5_TRIPS|nr:hypothetical protein T4A_14035 [Trichinella pseudospiralis]KRY84498.1 hypothetical protein T4D_9318 [Trichinella pseudospiralis]KRZ23768.1 hypothetical protein T4B_10627 [Trichinella pseudospiralis]
MLIQKKAADGTRMIFVTCNFSMKSCMFKTSLENDIQNDKNYYYYHTTSFATDWWLQARRMG